MKIRKLKEDLIDSQHGLKMKTKEKEQYWILIRNGEVRNVFKNRKEAVKHFKRLLKQTLKDFDKQDKVDEYDYSIEIPEIKIKPVEWRKSYLSLL